MLVDEQYVGFLRSVQVGNRDHPADIGVLHLFDQERDRASVNSVYKAGIADGLLEVLLSVGILGSVALFRTFRTAQSDEVC